MVNPDDIRWGELTKESAEEFCKRQDLTGLRLIDGEWWAWAEDGSKKVRLDPRDYMKEQWNAGKELAALTLNDLSTEYSWIAENYSLSIIDLAQMSLASEMYRLDMFATDKKRVFSEHFKAEMRAEYNKMATSVMLLKMALEIAIANEENHETNSHN